MKTILVSGLILAAATTANFAQAQRAPETQPAVTPESLPDPTAPTERSKLTSDEAPSTDTFMQVVAMNDMFQIALSNLALKKSSDPGIKSFAQSMAKDHTASGQQLAAIIKKENMSIALPSEMDPEHSRALESMQGLTGNKFDLAFAETQQATLEKMLTTLEEYRDRGRDDAVKSFAAEQARSVEKYLAESKSLARANM